MTLRTIKPSLRTLATGMRAVQTPTSYRSAPAEQRVRGRKLQRRRAALFSRRPLCAECLRHDRVTVATERDHIIPLWAGGADDDENTQGLCSACHAAKTAREAGERARGGGSKV